jgi:hypothetical protein
VNTDNSFHNPGNNNVNNNATTNPDDNFFGNGSNILMSMQSKKEK